MIFGGPPFGGSLAYYYVDDICVTTDSLYNEMWTDIIEVVKQESNDAFSIFPNPNSGHVTLSGYRLSGTTEMEIFNTLGEKSHEQKIISEKTEIDLSAYPKGIYFVKVIQGNRVAVKKIILM
ncbi:MAG: T9SS type A sorting domain-containing protein [Bacteroidia bacterium]|nr:T9SS type A sorting domain-containing protein [Bacteroidia bacterium]